MKKSGVRREFLYSVCLIGVASPHLNTGQIFMRNLFAVLFGSLLGTLLSGQPVSGEKGEFRLHWGMVTVGTVDYLFEKVEVDEDGDAEEVIYYSKLEAKANAFMRRIHNFHTLLETWMSEDLSRSQRYSRNEITDDVVHQALFDWSSEEVRYARNEDIRVPLPLLDATQDPFSVIHAFRMGWIPREPGEYEVPVSDGQVVVDAKITVHERERMRTPAGRFYAIKVSADFKEVRAIFARPEGALIHVWLSDDEYLFPLRLQSEAMIGNFTSSLVSYELPGNQKLPAAR